MANKKHYVIKLKKPARKEGDKPYYMECGHLFMPDSGVGTLFWNDRGEEYAVFLSEPRSDDKANRETST